MRVLFINQADEEILNETINRVSVDNSTNNIDELKFNSCDNISKCKYLGKFLKENDFNLKSIFSSNDPVCLKTAENISSNFEEDLEIFMNLEFRDYNQDRKLPINLKNELKDTINKFKFCEMNSIENIEKYKNIENKVEWYRKIFYN